jgi:carboxylesterase
VTAVVPGAEPMSAAGGPVGVLALHGFTGSPSSMRGIAESCAAAGYSVELPLLPGHGTSVGDMMGTGWSDWSAAAEAAYAGLAARCDRVVVAGLSMGGSLTLWLGSRYPAIAGLVCINPAVRPQPPEVVELVQGMIDVGEETSPGIGSDIAKEGVTEVAYEETPLRPLLSLMDGLAALQGDLGQIVSPLLLFTSPEDHVVDPGDSDHLASATGGPVRRVVLERSYHVATQDHDADLIVAGTLEFVAEVTA